LDSPMLLQKLVQQHRVHRFVANGVRLSIAITSHQIRIHSCHLLSHQSKLQHTFWINLPFVTKSHRLEAENCLACIVHWFNFVLETCGGGQRAELARRIYKYRHSACRSCTSNAGDKSFSMGGVHYAVQVRERDFVADANDIRLASNTAIADIDIVTAGGETLTGSKAQRDVKAAGCIANECMGTVDSIKVASCVRNKREIAVGSVMVARCVA